MANLAGSRAHYESVAEHEPGVPASQAGTPLAHGSTRVFRPIGNTDCPLPQCVHTGNHIFCCLLEWASIPLARFHNSHSDFGRYFLLQLLAFGWVIYFGSRQVLKAKSPRYSLETF